MDGMNARLFALFRSLLVSAVFVSIWTWFLPRTFARGPLEPHWNIAAAVLMLLGGAIMLRCVLDFGWSGEGTPFPLDPPRRFVVRALYRYVRNPMYLGMGLFLTGEALLLPAITRQMLIMLGVLVVVVHAFVTLYEEPSLRTRFGDEYVDYCRNVRRWLPRLTPFDKRVETALPSAHLD
jgi:protein-S-isoprenylcysteine O-methyltransferase Ste14